MAFEKYIQYRRIRSAANFKLKQQEKLRKQDGWLIFSIHRIIKSEDQHLLLET